MTYHERRHMKKSRIRKICDNKSRLDHHLAKLDIGEEPFSQGFYYRDEKTKLEYFVIEGALAWPWPKDKIPGVVVVLGVKRTNHPRPTFQVLDEAVVNRGEDLLKKCLKFRSKWEDNEKTLLRGWWGDPGRFMTSCSNFNAKLMKKDKKGGFYLSSFMEFERPNHLEIYLNSLQRALEKDSSGRKCLFLGDAHYLRMRLCIPNWPKSGQSENYPALLALSGLVHSLLTLRPWEKDCPPEELVFSPDDQLALEKAEEDKLWQKIFGPEDWVEEDMASYDDGGLAPTLKG
jgi:hypothetical protein